MNVAITPDKSDLSTLCKTSWRSLSARVPVAAMKGSTVAMQVLIIRDGFFPIEEPLDLRGTKTKQAYRQMVWLFLSLTVAITTWLNVVKYLCQFRPSFPFHGITSVA